VAYLLIRAFVDDRDQAARYCAVLGIIGALDLPIIHYSVEWWRSIHPSPIVLKKGGGGLTPEMLKTLFVSMGAFTILFVVLVTVRMNLQAMREKAHDLRRLIGQRRST
jgi:heme exporter protein C